MARVADPGSKRLATLVVLVRLGAGRSYAGISTAKLGDALGLTQQGASARLSDLETSGLVERAHSGKGLAVRLTEAGLAEVASVYSDLKGALERGGSTVLFHGRVFTGFGEGAYYIALKGYAAQFQKSLGFVPYPGTLNLRLSDPGLVEQRRLLKVLPGIEVLGFKDGQRTYGPVKCFRARVLGRHHAAILAIERTHYDSTVLEVIAPVNLRQALGLKDGDECTVTSYLR